MIKVNDLQKGKKNRYIVTLNEKEYDVNENLILNYHLVKGYVIEDDRILDDIISDISYYDFYDIALTYLERNVKSSGEIKNYLKKKGASDEISSKIVSALISHKLLDDKKYFELYVSHYIRIGYGPIYIINKAKQSGIPQNIIEEFDFINYKDDIKASCLKQSQKKIKLIKESDAYQKIMKLKRYLISRGYDYDMINEVIKETI